MIASTDYALPDPDLVKTQIDALQEELAALKRLRRAALAASRAELARRRREQANAPSAPDGCPAEGGSR